MSKHTPGPWKIAITSLSHGESLVFTSGSPYPDDPNFADARIAQVAGGLGYVPDDDRCHESEANAHLIAAAPDLLAACEAVIRDAHDNGEDSPVNQYRILDVVRAAIAKARGENGGVK